MKHGLMKVRGDSGLRVFENRFLMPIFGPLKDENEEWSRLHNEALRNLYRSYNIVRLIKYKRLRWAGHVDRNEEGRSAFKILTGNPAGRRSLGRPRRRWEDSTRMDLKERGISIVIRLIWFRIVIIEKSLRVRH
jgi:hypothetical protein